MYVHSLDNEIFNIDNQQVNRTYDLSKCDRIARFK